MREWKRGEIQAIGSAGKLMLFIGMFVVLHAVWLEFRWARFVDGLPRTLVSGPFLQILVGTVVFFLGVALGVWLWRVRKRTGISTRPFDRTE